MQLRQLQETLWKLIAAPEGVRRALDDGGGGSGPTSLEPLVLGTSRMGAIERLDVYANSYFFRLLDVLTEDFPALLAQLGPDEFQNLATDFVLAHPSTEPSLRWFGERLPAYLDQHRLTNRYPFLADLARLERARVDAYDAPDRVPLDAGTLAAIPPENWGDLEVELSPSLRLVRSEFALDALHESLVSGGSSEPDVRRPVSIRVWRRGFDVEQRAVDAAEMTVTDVIAGGGTFGEACACLADGEALDDAARTAARILATWLPDGLIVGVSVR